MKTDAAVVNNSGAVIRRKRSKAQILKMKSRKWAISIFRGLLMLGLCFMIIQPIITRFATSIMAEKDLYDGTIILLPRNVTLKNFEDAFNLLHMNWDATKSFWDNVAANSLINTAWISVVVAACQVVSCTLVAYGFARYDFPLKKLWFGCVVAMIIIPPQTISTSLANFFSNFDILGIIKATKGKTLNLRGSLLPYVAMSFTCMGLKNGLYIYMLRQYFRGVPKSLEEAAYIDGCGTLHTFTKIMLPDAVPIIMSCFLFGVVWQWTDLFYARNFLAGFPTFSVKLSTMVSSMQYYFGENGATVVVSNAKSQQFISIGVVICSMPLIILYCFTQKTFVKSLAMTGSKE